VIQKKIIEAKHFALRLLLAGRQKSSVHVTFSGMVSLFWSVKRNPKNINFQTFLVRRNPIVKCINKQT